MKQAGPTFPSLAVLAFICFLVGLINPAGATEPSREGALAEANRGGYRLITTEELWDNYRNADDLLLIDTRQSWEYRMGHIEGAVHFPMEPTLWARWRSRSALAELLGENKEKLLVFY